MDFKVTPTKRDKNYLQSIPIIPKLCSSKKRGRSFLLIAHLQPPKSQPSPRKGSEYKQKIKISRFLRCSTSVDTGGHWFGSAARPFGSKSSRRGGARVKKKNRCEKSKFALVSLRDERILELNAEERGRELMIFLPRGERERAISFLLQEGGGGGRELISFLLQMGEGES